MKPTNVKISEQFADFIDLTDENLEEINLPEVGRVQGAQGWSCGSCFGWSCGAFVSVNASSFAGSCSCGSCESCCSCESCGSCGSCSCFSCSCWSCGSCSCGSCEGFGFWG